AFALINITVLAGGLQLLFGINNGGQEYREYIWPIMALFAIALILSIYNLYKTVATRELEEIYISNWYILAAFIMTVILVSVTYLPGYQQNGISQTVVQGYYM